MRALVFVTVVTGCGFAPDTHTNAIDAHLPGDGAHDAPADGAPDARPPDAPVVLACSTDASYVANPSTGRRYFASVTPASWAGGQQACANKGAYLAVIDDATENAYVDSLQTGSFWIGMSDSAQEGTWVWITGALVDAGYKNWRAGNPNNEGGDQNCGEMDPSGGTWNDYTCPSVEGYVCECPG